MTCGTSISLRVPNRKQQFIDKISVIIKEINAIINLPQKISEFPRIVTLKDLNKIEVLDTLLLKTIEFFNYRKYIYRYIKIFRTK